MALPRFTFSLFLLALISCSPQAPRDPVLGAAFIGPANVNLRKDVGPSATVATLHFGEKVDIIGKRRIFVKVRTARGVEGWVDLNMLLEQSDMDQIRSQSATAQHYPSQGTAVTDEAMNVHSQPSMSSPSYIQLKPGEKFYVLEHRLVATPASTARKSIINQTPKVIKRPKKPSKNKVPPPPAPAAPELPADWKDLSREGEEAATPKSDDTPAIPYQDWSRGRTTSGNSGWGLPRRIYMAIPDEVAQYAEGRRITSYFPIGKVHDQDRVKEVWLWTTSEAGRSYDFDGFRVFIWSLRHHRYETALIQRRLQGYFPTLVDSAAGTFSVCIQKADGQRYRREYRLVENVVRFEAEKACEANVTKPTTVPPPDTTQKAPEGTLEKLKGELKSIIKR